MLIPIFAVPTALALIKLGALSVWVNVLSAGLIGVAVIVGCGAGAVGARYMMRGLRRR